MKKIFTFLLLTLVSNHFVTAQDGALDSSFAENGVLLLDLVGSNETAHKAIVQPDGKIVVVASAKYPHNFDIEVVRLNEDGSLDSTFAVNGQYHYLNELGSDLGYGLEMLEDGSFLVSGSHGTAEPANTEMVLIKLTPDGVQDTSFGDNGVVIRPVGVSEDYARDIAVADNGDIYLGGTSKIQGFGFYRSVIAKFDATGQVDSTFGTDGIFMWDTDSIVSDVHQLEIMADGHLLTSGRTKPAGTNRISMYKVLSDGSGFDTSFGTDGTVLAPYEGTGYGMTIHENGNILVTGNNLTSMGYNLVVLAYNQDGTVNTDFGMNGVVSVDNDINDVGLAITVQPDGKILAGGESGGTFFVGGPRKFFSVRMDATGMIDSTWGENGLVSTQTSDLFAFANGITIQPDGKVILVGASAASTLNDLTVVRYGNFIDQDMDGFSIADDCDDTVAEINPDAVEIPNNDVDEDCDGVALIIDEDMDGFNSDEDCDDNNAEINPDAEEIPNNDVDEDCDGTALIIDEDMDGFNSDEDCDDTNPDINPDAEEIPNNDVDENCDGEILIVSVRETALAQQFNLYPNPASDQVWLQLKGNDINLEGITINDVAGRTLRNINIENFADQMSISLEGFPKGVLLITIQTNEGVAVKRLVKK